MNTEEWDGLEIMLYERGDDGELYAGVVDPNIMVEYKVVVPPHNGTLLRLRTVFRFAWRLFWS